LSATTAASGSGYEHKHGDAADGWGDGDHNHAANHNVGGVLDESGEYGDHMHPDGKNPGDVFEVTTKPFSDAHFAVYPPELCEKPLKTTCPPTVCAECGMPYERQVNTQPGEYEYSDRADAVGGRTQASGTMKAPPKREHEGWAQACDCDTDETQSGVALDPFVGAGTTCLVAKRLARRFIGVDLNPDYVALAQRRVGVTVDEPHRLPETDEETVSLAAFTDGGTTDE